MGAGLNDQDGPFQVEKARRDSKQVISPYCRLHCFQATPGDTDRVDRRYVGIDVATPSLKSKFPELCQRV